MVYFMYLQVGTTISATFQLVQMTGNSDFGNWSGRIELRQLQRINGAVQKNVRW